ncbi:protein lethal(2)essential for life-like [Saccoglossus kowalevskii]|uniref:Heat shock protein beta-1-like n=1 Tax=Saccoglossus kowalevskii TaxID=10224 RepID=A0ABM0MFJ9_SACKO|nr:PREDICTED: heat shock protein beta-1-like [Saccoglossus kowalevskii]
MTFRMFPTFRMARQMAREMQEVMTELQSPPHWRLHPFSRQWLDKSHRRLLDETFGYMEHMANMANGRPSMASVARCRYTTRPARCVEEKIEDKHENTSKVESNNIGESGNKFKVAIDLANFRPENIEVRLQGNRLQIRAIQEDTGKEGYREYMEYCQNYDLPETVDIEALTSNLTKEGTLTLEAPLMDVRKPYTRTIPITREVPQEAEVEAKKEEDTRRIPQEAEVEAKKEEDTSSNGKPEDK